MNKNQTLREINAVIVAMLDSKWSYFSAPSYMRGFLLTVQFGASYTTTFCDPICTCLFVTHIYGLFSCAYMRVCKKMVIYLGIKTPQSRKLKERKYAWQKNARISCHNFETNGQPHRSRLLIGSRTQVKCFSLWVVKQLDVGCVFALTSVASG